LKKTYDTLFHCIDRNIYICIIYMYIYNLYIHIYIYI
jgi:hypothetical protein